MQSSSGLPFRYKLPRLASASMSPGEARASTEEIADERRRWKQMTRERIGSRTCLGYSDGREVARSLGKRKGTLERRANGRRDQREPCQKSLNLFVLCYGTRSERASSDNLSHRLRE